MYWMRTCSSLPTELYDPKAFITHAAWLGQAFAHCPIFPTAASRRSLGRVAVPVWLIILSDQLPVLGLVSRYLANYLMGRGFIFRGQLPRRGHLSRQGPESPSTYAVLAVLSNCCPPPEGRLSTCYAPVRHFTRRIAPSFSFDLHVLSPPLTFALSQDQTLQLNCHIEPKLHAFFDLIHPRDKPLGIH